MREKGLPRQQKTPRDAGGHSPSPLNDKVHARPAEEKDSSPERHEKTGLRRHAEPRFVFSCEGVACFRFPSSHQDMPAMNAGIWETRANSRI